MLADVLDNAPEEENLGLGSVTHIRYGSIYAARNVSRRLNGNIYTRLDEGGARAYLTFVIINGVMTENGPQPSFGATQNEGLI